MVNIITEFGSIDALLNELKRQDIKIWRIGDDLHFDAPIGGITSSIHRQLVEHKQAILSWLRSSAAPSAGPAADAEKPFPLDDMQQAYWIGQMGGLDLSVSARYYLEVENSRFDAQAFARAWPVLVERHGMLRAIILPTGEQQILPHVPQSPIEILDLRETSHGEVASRLDTVRTQMLRCELPSHQWPQYDFRISVLPNRIRLHFRFNLWMIDGRSLQVLAGELLALCENPEHILPELELTARDYVLAKIQYRVSNKHRTAQEYWHARLDTLPPAPEMPFAQQPSAVGEPRFTHLAARLDQLEWKRLRSAAANAGVTGTFALCAAYSEILARWNKNMRFTVTVLHANRLPLHSQSDAIVGNFGATILLEVDYSANDSFITRAKRLQSQFWRDIAHASVSGIEIARQLIQRNANSIGAVFPVTFTSVTSDGQAAGDRFTQGLSSFTHVHSALEVPQVFLDHQVVEDATGGVILYWDYVDDLFPRNFVQEMFEAYVGFVRRLAADPDDAWHEHTPELLPVFQLERLASVNATKGYYEEELLHHLFARRAVELPDHPAVIDCRHTLTYREIAQRARQLGHKLRGLGARPNQLIGVVMEKGWEQVVALLGTLMAGAAYVPIDPELPQERRTLLLKESEVRLVLTQSWLDQALSCPSGIQKIYVDVLTEGADDLPDLAPLQTLDDLAYVIFTSGSTGKPKGVMIDHRGAVNTIMDVNRRFHVTANDRMLALSSLSFDLSVYDVFGILAAGGTVVFPDSKQIKEPSHWLELVGRHRITLWNSVPALAQLLVEDPSASSVLPSSALRLIMMSGDWIPLTLPEQIKSVIDHVRVVSLGGATEASIWSILHPIERVEPEWKSIPYGRPMANQTFFVLNDKLQVCPTWVIGHLYIGGIGLARGYWKDEQKTDASFIIHPRMGKRLYRTGDIGRYLPNGEIEFLGREDFQVKVSGYRIECTEIEAALLEHPHIKAAVVSVVGDKRGIKQLVSHAVAHSETVPTPEQLQAYLSQKLPQYMIPSSITLLPSLPLTANGKVDRKALPAPAVSTTQAHDSSDAAPRDELERRMASLWCEILNVAQIGIRDNFFGLGGNSFAGMRLMAHVQRHFGKDLRLTALLDNPTLEQFATLMRSSDKDSHASVLVNIQTNGSRRPLFCVHPVGGNVLCYASLARQLGPQQPVYGLQSGMLLRQPAATSITEMAAAYIEALRTVQPKGPFALAGWSMGGVIAWEMAQQLKRRGETISLLALIDSSVPDPQSERETQDDADFLAGFATDLSGSGIHRRLFPLSLHALRKMTPNRQLDFFLDEGRRHGILPPELERKQLQLLFDVFKANMRALNDYVPQRYPGKAMLIQARDSSFNKGAALDWKCFAAGADVHNIAGDHFTIMQEPLIATLAAHLSGALQSEEGSNSSAPKVITEDGPVDELKQILEQLFSLGTRGVQVSEHTDFMEELGLDSIKMIRLLSEIEQRFDIDIFSLGADSNRYRTIKSLGQLLASAKGQGHVSS